MATLAAGSGAYAETVAEQVAEDVRHEIRPGGIAQPGFWTKNAMRFMYPPSLEFLPVEGAKRYEFTVCGPKTYQGLTLKAEKPVLRLTAKEWTKLSNGWVNVVCVPQDASGKKVGLAQDRFFWKKVPFAEGGPKAVRGHADASRRAFAYLIDMPFLKYLREKGTPDPSYELNCYPSKMNAAVIRAMVSYAKLEPSRAEDAMKLAHAAADYLLSVAEPKDAALPGFTPTYAGEALAAKKNKGQTMNCYPAGVADSFLRLYEATQEKKYLAAAELIGETYLRDQGADGTWALKQMLKTGKVLGPNRLFPLEVMFLFQKLNALTGRADFLAAADKAFAYIDKGPLVSWNWEGQFEDVDPTAPYENLTKHPACSTAIYCLRRFPGDAKRLAEARDLIRFAEDQFVDWKRPADTPVGRRVLTWGPYASHWSHGTLANHTLYPAVMEQYRCYVPVDASAAKLIRTYLALYKAEGKAMDLAKAKALGDMMTRVQREDGSIPTWWDPKGPRKDDWINCMISSAEALAQLAETEDKAK